jgi:hypothetical protein
LVVGAVSLLICGILEYACVFLENNLLIAVFLSMSKEKHTHTPIRQKWHYLIAITAGRNGSLQQPQSHETKKQHT